MKLDFVAAYKISFIFSAHLNKANGDAIKFDCIKRTVCLQSNLSGEIEPTPAPSMVLVPAPSPAENFGDGSMEEPERPEIKVSITAKIDISSMNVIACRGMLYLVQLCIYLFLT